MKLRMKTAGDCRRALAKIANGILDGSIEPRVGNAAVYAVSALISSLRVDETERKIAELEEMLKGEND